MTKKGKDPEWKGVTGGGTFGQCFLFVLLHWCSVRAGYFFVALVSPFYLIFNGKGRKTIYRYFRLQHRFSPLKSLQMSVKNHYRFGQIIMDRFSILAQGKTRFNVEIDGQSCFDRLINSEKGFVMVSAHVGNFEIGGYLMHQDKKPVNAVVFAGETVNLQQNRNKQFGCRNVRLIPVMPDMSHLFLINSALNNGEIVCMPCDRLFGSSKNVRCRLLNGEIDLPIGAFQLAAIHNVEVITLFVMKEVGMRYRLYVKSLNCQLINEFSTPPPHRAQKG
ncbi:MAG: lipid A biosynthesis (KDO)2-(lauroyl)-lipid IVA acyltransferase, partial [Bacteroidales bacterium]|nr:lipid A biosynthesis (KDO)2-(lauroyl)-lipid IVA acyltransferase [Bacteroidales bacterium]